MLEAGAGAQGRCGPALRAEDYQLAYALDILRGLGFLNGSN
jgi:hypothetical protein